MNNDIEKILFDQAQLDKRMDEMAAELVGIDIENIDFINKEINEQIIQFKH